MPLPLALALLALGLILLLCTKRRNLGKFMAFAGLAWLAFCSNKPASRLLLRPLESQYASIPEISSPAQMPGALASCAYVAVLGGGHTDDDRLCAGSRLSESALARLAEGLRLARLLPDSRLIVSGPQNARGEAAHGRVLRDAAVALGFPTERILVIDSARDTDDESRAIADIAGSRPIALVTSAWHMPRAAALFRKKGVAFVACPADFKAKLNHAFSPGDYNWDSDSLTRSTLAIREYIGLFWSKLRRQT